MQSLKNKSGSAVLVGHPGSSPRCRRGRWLRSKLISFYPISSTGNQPGIGSYKLQYLKDRNSSLSCSIPYYNISISSEKETDLFLYS